MGILDPLSRLGLSGWILPIELEPVSARTEEIHALVSSGGIGLSPQWVPFGVDAGYS